MSRCVRTLGLVAVLIGLASAACRSSDAPPRRSRHTDILLTPDTELIRGSVPRRTTLDALLRSHGLRTDHVDQLIASVRRVFDPRRLRATQPYVLERTLDGALRLFRYEIDEDRYLNVTPGPGELHAAVVPIPKTRHEALVAGRIDDRTPSLFEAMDATGERAELTIAMADIFAGEIDFNTELQPGDQFALAFEKFTREDGPQTYGEVAAAEFHNDGRVLRAIRFTPPGGKPAYYDEQGRSLRRFFLRSPLKFEPRVTSGFSLRRFHPVLHTYRAHLGVDYGAPIGAPVVAVASGTVVSAGFDAANGRIVRLRHRGGYETYYLHLSAFGPGIRPGARVGQGQLIGRVGASGLATGPHLDYRLRKNGVFVNPLREHRNMPPGEPVPAAAMAAFRVERDRALRLLDTAMRTLPAPVMVTSAR